MGGGHVSRPDFGMPQPDPAYPLTEFYLLLQHALDKAGRFALPALYARVMRMKHRWTTLLWELWAAQALCAVAALPPGSAFHTCPALALPGLALAAAVPTAWAAWALLAEPPDGLPPEQLLEQVPGFDFATLCDFERPAAVP